MGKINCPILLVNGKDDQNVPADECAEDVRAHTHTHTHTHTHSSNDGKHPDQRFQLFTWRPRAFNQNIVPPALKHLIWNIKKEDYSHQRGTLCFFFFYLTFDPQIALLMNAAGNGHLLSRVLYPDTGHLIEPPYSPHFRASNFKAAGVATKTGESSWHRVTRALCFITS